MLQNSYIVAFIFLFLALPAFAQVEVEEAPRNEKMDYMLIEIGWETFIDKPGDVEYRWYNNGFNIALFYDQPFGKKSPISGAIGLGFSTQSYYSNAQVRRDTTLDYNWSYWKRVEEPYRNNKISISWIELPIELRFRGKEDARGNRFKVAIGVKGGLRVDVHDKLKDQSYKKFKTYYFPDVTKYRIGGILRIGYGKVSVSGFYSFTGFFIPGAGRKMNQLSISIAIMAF